MSSSSTDGRPAFLSTDRASVVRLVVVITLGLAALIGPLVATTSARFTEQDQIGVTISATVTPTPIPSP